MTEKEIYEFLLSITGNAYGAAGIMGNLYAESGLKSNNLQNTGNKKLGMTDEEFCAAYNSGAYTNFAKDSIGFGLAQWTSSGRKQSLANFMKSHAVPIEDCKTQLLFLYEELKTGYKTTLIRCQNARSIREASDAFCKGFERPKDQSEKAFAKRASYGQKFFDKYAGSLCPRHVTVTASVLRIRRAPNTLSNIEGRLVNGSKVYILEVSSDRKWGRIDRGWICLDYVI